MAAGLGFKTFTTGEVLTAADTNGYLMQGVLVFASAAARDAAITSPQEGQFAYLKDTNVTTYYTGSAWTNLDTTGMTNPMTTTGDVIYSSPGSTPVRLGIGSTGNVLTVSGGVPVWAAAAGGGKILQVVQGTTTTSTTIASTSYTDTTLTATITPSAATSKILCLVSQNFKNSRGSSPADGGSSIKLVRGATDIVTRGAPEVDLLYNISTATAITDFATVTNIMYVDSPSTTSATTYKTQGVVRFTVNSNQVTYQTSSSQSQIILLEIGA